MLTYRPFKNSDPPLLVELWRRNSSTRGLAQTLNVDVLDAIVLAKPYFDRAGLILALDGQQLVGFVHVGFGPSEDRRSLDQRRGVVSMLLVDESGDAGAVATELLKLGEQYLEQAGAQEIFALGVGPICPFYLGLYGGSDLPGVLETDLARLQVFRQAEYTEVDRVSVFQRNLANFRPPVDRQTMQIRRNTDIDIAFDPAPTSWWEACTMGCFEQLRFVLRPNTGGTPLATATFWNMESLATSWAQYTMGLISIDVMADQDSEAAATFLLGESLKRMSEQGIACIEAHAMDSNAAASAIFKKLGFDQIDTGIVLRK